MSDINNAGKITLDEELDAVLQVLYSDFGYPTNETPLPASESVAAVPVAAEPEAIEFVDPAAALGAGELDLSEETPAAAAGLANPETSPANQSFLPAPFDSKAGGGFGFAPAPLAYQPQPPMIHHPAPAPAYLTHSPPPQQSTPPRLAYLPPPPPPPQQQQQQQQTPHKNHARNGYGRHLLVFLDYWVE